MNVLICTIVRNEARHLDRWYSQIRVMVTAHPDIGFFLSVFENDSTDGSFQKIIGYDWSVTKARILVTAQLNNPYYLGGKSPERTHNLAYCRNQTMYSFPFLKQQDYVLWVEPDTEFSPEVADRMLNHEKHYGLKLDVFTGKSVHPKTDSIYDSWGTRKTSNQSDYIDGDEGAGGFQPMWSTFSCLALYRAEPIIKGIAFGGVNDRLGRPDCDTVVICEKFRAAGYDKIYWDTNLKVTHFCE